MMKSVRPFAFVLLLLLPTLVAAEVRISKKCRIRNLPPGRCGWCALETLARHQHIRALYGITESHPYRATLDDMESFLTSTGIKYQIQYPGSTSVEILEDAMTKGVGAVVGFEEQFPGAGKHIVTLTDFGPDEVRLIDSNDPDCHIRTMPMDRFLYWWDGFALVLEHRTTARK